MRNNDNMYIDICVNSVFEEEYSMELTILFVLEGEVLVFVSGQQIMLAKDKLYLISPDTAYRLSLSRDTILARFSLNYSFLCRKADRDYIRFSNSALSDDDSFREELKSCLKKALMYYLSDGNKCTLKSETLTYEIALLLAEKYTSPESSQFAAGWTDDRRIAAIQNYVRSNYMHSVSLTELSEEMFVSVSTLSRLFYKKTGLSFVQYVKNYRLERVRQALIETDDSITNVAVSCGFSSASAMNRDFRNHHQMTPKEYRERFRQQTQKRNEEKWLKDQNALRSLYNTESLSNPTDSSSGPVFVHADLMKESPYRQWRNTIMNVGPAAALNNPKLQAQLLDAHRQLSCDYYRIWSLMSRRLFMMDDNDSRHLNFDQLDTILDFFTEHNLRLFLDLGPRTSLTRVSERRVITDQVNQDISFESEEQWEQFLGRLLRHLINRYGEHTVSSWVFEVSFFLSDRPYYTDPDYQPLRVWEHSVRCIRRYIPEALIAGPGLPAQTDQDLMRKMVRLFLCGGIYPDIFTAFHFPVRVTDFQQLKSNRTAEFIKDTNENFMQDGIQAVRSALDDAGYKGLYYVTDWNFSFSNRNYVQDSCYRAAFYMRNIFHCSGQVDALGIWYLSDLIDNRQDSPSPLIGSSGILSKDGIRKPAFYTFAFLHLMGSHLLYQDENCLITRRSSNDVQILCCNCISLGPNYYLTEENSYLAGEIEELFVSSDAKNMHVMLEHLDPHCTYMIRQQVVNRSHGNALQEWLTLDDTYTMTPGDISYLRQKTQPLLERSSIYVEDGTINLDLHLLPNEIRWISIREARRA